MERLGKERAWKGELLFPQQWSCRGCPKKKPLTWEVEESSHLLHKSRFSYTNGVGCFSVAVSVTWMPSCSSFWMVVDGSRSRSAEMKDLAGSLVPVSLQVAQGRGSTLEVAPAHEHAAQETSLLSCLIGTLAFCSVLHCSLSVLFSRWAEFGKKLLMELAEDRGYQLLFVNIYGK